MKVLTLSDTCGYHNDMPVYENIDLLIYAGNCTNYHDLNVNQAEFASFFKWLYKYNAKYKVIIAGNHDAWARNPSNLEKLKDYGIIYLEHNSVEIEGLKIFGSPYTPVYYNWFFMRNKDELKALWKKIPNDTDIVITHGPPKGILDLVYNKEDCLTQVGDEDLLNKVLEIQPKYHIFGNIHNHLSIINQGMKFYKDITFINASCINDAFINKHIESHGIVFDI